MPPTRIGRARRSPGTSSSCWTCRTKNKAGYVQRDYEERGAGEHPTARDIDQNLVDAQQARRILDRLVGYELSPLLWKKIRRGLSAGRVQSVATRMVDDRDREIEEFQPEEYWTLDANLLGADVKKHLCRSLPREKRQKAELKNEEAVNAVVRETEGEPLRGPDGEAHGQAAQPLPPFTTSTLQQEASRKLSMTPRRTMAIAQQLY